MIFAAYQDDALAIAALRETLNPQAIGGRCLKFEDSVATGEIQAKKHGLVATLTVVRKRPMTGGNFVRKDRHVSIVILGEGQDVKGLPQQFSQQGPVVLVRTGGQDELSHKVIFRLDSGCVVINPKFNMSKDGQRLRQVASHLHNLAVSKEEMDTLEAAYWAENKNEDAA